MSRYITYIKEISNGYIVTWNNDWNDDKDREEDKGSICIRTNIALAEFVKDFFSDTTIQDLKDKYK